MINPLVDELAEHVPANRACELLGRPRSSHYRSKLPPVQGPRRPRPTPLNALSAAERATVVAVVTSERFCDKAVAQAWATLLDEGTYLCSMSTMHRILAAHNMSGERRAQARHPAKKKPELLATGPGQVWSWDITKIRGPVKGTWYHLYVIIDIYSRYIVGWTLQNREDSTIAADMIAAAISVHGQPDSLHADRGTSMTSKTVTALLLDLGVDRSHSHPHVSNDNPYSEAAFKTLKYAPVFPDHFGSLADARAFCEGFFAYYNHEHHHSGIGLHTPASVHYGTVTEIRRQRQATLDAAYQAHPERFANQRPVPPKLPTAAWINQPQPEALIQSA
ncbi:IS3 family transposase [Gordonia sp. NB41Y]|uniref:IS3 family transposase n=1 Tax=Gordonia sp. NB41Y TaxID=875808 RepID=UPI0006B14917|nr:IS3 family transposase [Gordonia sp. NB41Y]EMP10879.2 transposase [Gordonia sp. NB41Y]WLP88455.1 IS3 family transposase [Gordonia sp. NB41Y]